MLQIVPRSTRFDWDKRDTIENLSKVKAGYLVPANISECMLLTVDDSENYGEVIQWITGSDAPKTHMLSLRWISITAIQ